MGGHLSEWVSGHSGDWVSECPGVWQVNQGVSRVKDPTLLYQESQACGRLASSLRM